VLASAELSSASGSDLIQIVHAQQVQEQLACQLEHAIQMSLIADLTDQGGLPDTGFQVQPPEGRRERFGQAS